MRVLTSSHFERQAIRRKVAFFETGWQVSWRWAGAALAILILLATAWGQQEEKPKIPGIDKIISAQEHLAFHGTVKSLDEKHNILSVNSVEGGDTEIFPIKHSTHVETADGFRKKLDVLSPGTLVTVYYDQRADHRTVTRIELLVSESKKKEPHS